MRGDDGETDVGRRQRESCDRALEAQRVNQEAQQRAQQAQSTHSQPVTSAPGPGQPEEPMSPDYASEPATTGPPAPQPGHSINCTYYFGGPEHHWIQKKSNDGSLLILEDGSVWAVVVHDRITSMMWLPVNNILIVELQASGNRYLLINKDDGEKVEACFLGR